LIQYGFEECNAHRIVAYCNPQNNSSWRLLERLDMRREGHFYRKPFLNAMKKAIQCGMTHMDMQYCQKNGRCVQNKQTDVYDSKPRRFVGIGIIGGATAGWNR